LRLAVISTPPGRRQSASETRQPKICGRQRRNPLLSPGFRARLRGHISGLPIVTIGGLVLTDLKLRVRGRRNQRAFQAIVLIQRA